MGGKQTFAAACCMAAYGRQQTFRFGVLDTETRRRRLMPWSISVEEAGGFLRSDS
jgi:hypothetical protein